MNHPTKSVVCAFSFSSHEEGSVLGISGTGSTAGRCLPSRRRRRVRIRAAWRIAREALFGGVNGNRERGVKL